MSVFAFKFATCDLFYIEFLCQVAFKFEQICLLNLVIKPNLWHLGWLEKFHHVIMEIDQGSQRGLIQDIWNKHKDDDLRRSSVMCFETISSIGAI